MNFFERLKFKAAARPAWSRYFAVDWRDIHIIRKIPIETTIQGHSCKFQNNVVLALMERTNVDRLSWKNHVATKTSIFQKKTQRNKTCTLVSVSYIIRTKTWIVSPPPPISTRRFRKFSFKKSDSSNEKCWDFRIWTSEISMDRENTSPPTLKTWNCFDILLRALKSIQPRAIQTHPGQTLPVETGQMCLYRLGLYRFKCP